jgi:hypothetical protein
MSQRCRFRAFRAGAGAGLVPAAGAGGTGEIGGAPGSSLLRAGAAGLALARGAAAAPRQARADGPGRHINYTALRQGSIDATSMLLRRAF